MIESDYLARTEKMIREEWFRTHHATALNFPRHITPEEATRKGITNHIPAIVSGLRWANPENSNYLVTYLLYGATLFVGGDLGHAVYRWSPHDAMSLRWIANCNLPYFAEKIESLHRCAQSNEWRSDICEMRMKKFMSTHPGRKYSGWNNFTATETEWTIFVCAGEQPFRDDYPEAAGFGHVTSNRVIAHWLGLRMAFEEKVPALSQ